MAPPLERKELYHHKSWRSRSRNYFRLPRRTRRATYLCVALVFAVFYLLLRSATQWHIPTGYFAPEEPPVIPIRFPNLYSTLSQIIGNGGARKYNRNVVFVAANLTAASRLAGVACEMAPFRKSNVHLALVGFDTIDLEDFQRINGLPLEDDEGCRVHFHDARPLSAEVLPLERQQTAVRWALRHINDFMHPQAVLVDTTNEEQWFVDVAKEKTNQFQTTLIQLSEKSMGDLKWITRLSSGSLHHYNFPTFEVVIHADSHSGNLYRLLKSLQHAYYPSPEQRPKHVTIILDHSIPLHTFTKDILRRFHFPDQFRVSVRRPLLPVNDPERAALSFIESFYTVNPNHAVLFLDPNTELSPWYYHYLLYTTLEYCHAPAQGPNTIKLFGISLESPPSYISGARPFKAELPSTSTHFLYPAPVSRAALYFPEHWSEFNSYVSHRLNPHPRPGKKNRAEGDTPSELELSREISSTWRSPFVELVRARGYTMLYPSFKEALAVVHDEIPSSASPPPIRGSEKRLITSGGFLELLPGGDLPAWGDLPMLDLWGQRTSLRASDTAATSYRLSVSTCPDGTVGNEFQVNDLFCDEDGNSV